MDKTNNMLTADTITTAQIEALRTEAGEAGDDEQHAICRRALYGVNGVDHSTLTPAGAARIAGMSKSEARGICADVINDAAARE